MKEFIFSRNAVYETLLAGRRHVFQLQVADGVQQKGRIADILLLASERKIPLVHQPRTVLDRIHPAHQGTVLEVGPYPYVNLVDILDWSAELRKVPFILILDSLNDPQNFGTLLRTAEAVGIHGVILPLARSVEVTPVVVNTSSGASEHLLVARANLSQAIDELKGANVWIIGLDEQGEEFHKGYESHLQGGLGIVVGAEGSGIRPLVRSKCDFLHRLPMQGKIASLNAAAAGSVFLYLSYLARIEQDGPVS